MNLLTVDRTAVNQKRAQLNFATLLAAKGISSSIDRVNFEMRLELRESDAIPVVDAVN